jgi:hypothetical protein
VSTSGFVFLSGEVMESEKRSRAAPGRCRRGRDAAVAKGLGPEAAEAACKRKRHAVKSFAVGVMA